MMRLEERSIDCPYCGELISISIDPSTGNDAYVEDCQVCGRPIVFHLSTDPDGGIVDLVVRRENE